MGRGSRPTGPLNLAIGAELRAARARAQLTIRELSLASGVPRSTLQKMLKGEAGLDAEYLYRVCAALGVTLHELIAAAEATLPPDDPAVDLPIVDG
jgi:transcriptional regulator with XRE-family HTH domain